MFKILRGPATFILVKICFNEIEHISFPKPKIGLSLYLHTLFRVFVLHSPLVKLDKTALVVWLDIFKLTEIKIRCDF